LGEGREGYLILPTLPLPPVRAPVLALAGPAAGPGQGQAEGSPDHSLGHPPGHRALARRGMVPGDEAEPGVSRGSVRNPM